MNVHPLLVHFPIALLTIYSLLELCRFRFFTKLPYWFYVKACLVIIGSLSSVATYLSGDAIEGMYRDFPDQMHLVEIHSRFAIASCLIFGVLAICYLIQWIKRDASPSQETKLPQGLARLTERFLQSWFAPLLAVAGLICITITGALGGALVYGPDIDPAVNFVYQLIVK